MNRIIFACAILAGTHSFACAQDPQFQVDDIIRREMLERNIPGLQVAIVQKGKIVMEKAYGFANLQDSIAVDNQTIFAINSCTKVFTGVAVMQLVEQGKVSLSAPVSSYLDSLPANWQKVTIRQLLTNTSGLPNLLSLLDPRTGGVGSLKTEAAIWQKLANEPLEFQPGERFSYNQTNSYLLGKLIDRLSGEPFADYFTNKQFGPIGMKHTVFGDSRDIIPHYAPTYNTTAVTDGRTLPKAVLTNNYYEYPYFRRTASGLNASAEDLARWVIALQGGRLLTRSSLDTMWSPAQFNNGQPTSWALGWGMNKFRTRHTAVGMSGGGRAAFLVYPEDELAVIILTNLAGSFPEDFLEEVAACYLPEIINADPNTFLRINLRKQGFDQAIPLVNAQIKKDPLFQPNEFELNEWAYRLMAKNRLKEALAILQLEVYLFPHSWNAYDSYGEGLLKNGDRNKAVEMYQRSVELNPANENGKKILKELQQASAR